MNQDSPLLKALLPCINNTWNADLPAGRQVLVWKSETNSSHILKKCNHAKC
jgi:hypothetical protein